MGTESDPLTEEQWATPLGQAFRRLLEDDEFAASVGEDPDGALADFDLDAPSRSALVNDAQELAGSEVEGFLYWWRANSLQTPTVLGAGVSEDPAKGLRLGDIYHNK